MRKQVREVGFIIRGAMAMSIWEKKAWNNEINMTLLYGN